MRVTSKMELRGLRQRERMQKLAEAAPAGIAVVPGKDEYRKVLKHPKSGGFPESGSATWADDRFTKRRLADGSITREQKKPEEHKKPEGHGQHEQASHARHREQQHSTDEPNDAA